MERVYDNQREAILVGYLAGVFDGEGTVGITRTQPKNYKNPRYTGRITLGMCVKPIVEKFQERYGGSLRVECVPNRRPVYRWALVGNKIILPFLEEMTPYLIEKQERALLLKEYTLGVSDVKRRTPNGRVLPTSEEELAIREDFYQRMKELNAWRAPATTNRENTGDGEVIC